MINTASFGLDGAADTVDDIIIIQRTLQFTKQVKKHMHNTFAHFTKLLLTDRLRIKIITTGYYLKSLG